VAEDTELAPAEELEPLAAPEAEQTEPDPIEKLASEMGWAPKDQFRGDESEWKPADEFIRAGRDINRSMARELRTVREEVTRIARTSADMTAQAIAERDAHWQNVHRQAVDDGNHELAERAVDERVKLKTQAAAPESTIPPETAEFMERNKTWMGKDPLATMRAEEIANQLAARGVPIPDQLVQVERAMRKEFPEHFAAPGKPPPGTQTAQARNAGQGSRAKGFADMPPESQAMAKDYLARHGVPLETTAKSYWADNARNERKVG